MDILDAGIFRALVIGDLASPAITYRGHVISGDDWQEVHRSATRGERAEILRLLYPSLLRATPAGAERADRQSPPWPPMTPNERAEEVDARLCVYGDKSLLPIVVATLASLPDPIADVACDEAAWLVVGRDSRAWTGSAHYVDAAGRERHRVVVLGPDSNETTIRHETGHLWFAPLPSSGPSPAITTAGEIGLLQHAIDAGFEARLDAHRQRAERLADALAQIWATTPLVSPDDLRKRDSGTVKLRQFFDAP